MPTPTASAPRPNVNVQQIQQRTQDTAQQAKQTALDKINQTHASLTQRTQDVNRTLLAQRSQAGVRPFQQSSFEPRRPDFASILGGQPAAPRQGPGQVQQQSQVNVQRQVQVNGQPQAPGQRLTIALPQSLGPQQAPGQQQSTAQPQLPTQPQSPASPYAGLHTLFGDIGKAGGPSAAQAKGLDGALSAMDGTSKPGEAAPSYAMHSMQETKGSFATGDGGTLTYDILNMNFQPTPAQQPTAQSATAAGAPPKPISDADKAWLQKVGGNNYAEVQLGQLALDKGTSDAVKAFGEHMVTDHGKGFADTQKLAASYGVEVPNQLNSEQQAQYDQLSSLSGQSFDNAYTDAMTQAHFKSIASYATEAATTTDPALKDFATQKLAKAEDHLADIQGVAQGKVPEDATPAAPAQPQPQSQGGFDVSQYHIGLTTRDGSTLSYDGAEVSPDQQQAQPQGALNAQGSTTSIKGPNGVGTELRQETV
jgi:putative membrane protein